MIIDDPLPDTEETIAYFVKHLKELEDETNFLRDKLEDRQKQINFIKKILMLFDRAKSKGLL